MLELKLDDTVYTCEGDWNELTRERLLGLMKIICAPIGEGRRMLEICRYMFRLNRKDMIRFARNKPIWIHDICTRLECLGWVRNDSALLTEYTIQHFWYNGILYMGPPKRILRINMDELVVCRMAFRMYAEKKIPADLDRLIAVLFRPYNPFWFLRSMGKNFTGDKRLPLNDWTLRIRIKRIARMDTATKLAILKQFSSAIIVFEKRFPMVFSKSGSAGTENKNDWMNLLFALSGGIFGNLRDTENSDCTEVFMKLEYDINESLKAKDKLKRK